MCQHKINTYLFFHEGLSVGVDPEAEGLGAQVLELGVHESDGPTSLVNGGGTRG